MVSRPITEDFKEKSTAAMRQDIEGWFDFGHQVEVVELRKATRIGCFDAYANGQLWRSRIGLVRVLEWIRKATPRVLSQHAV